MLDKRGFSAQHRGSIGRQDGGGIGAFQIQVVDASRDGPANPAARPLCAGRGKMPAERVARGLPGTKEDAAPPWGSARQDECKPALSLHLGKL